MRTSADGLEIWHLAALAVLAVILCLPPLSWVDSAWRQSMYVEELGRIDILTGMVFRLVGFLAAGLLAATLASWWSRNACRIVLGAFALATGMASAWGVFLSS